MPRKSTGEYPADWPEISEQTKRDAGYRCVRCNHLADIPNGYMLTVHHLDLNKSNCKWWNLAALCQRCHLQIQHKVILEQPYMFEHSEWFKPYAAGYYAFTNGHPDDKVYVLTHLDQLLDFGRPIQLFPTLI
jgi:5-methylcytosine-specific restriction endonuclease McrA